MSDQPRRPLAEMRRIAEALVEELRPYVDRIEIAGSIRRERPEVADIELVCVPRVEGRAQGGLFTEPLNLLDDYILCQPKFGYRLDKNGRTSCGERYKRLGVGDVALDLFSVLSPAQWGVLFLIRTGPSEFSRKMVTARRLGGYLPDDCIVHDGGVYRDGELIDMPEEADWFRLCGRVELSPRVRA